jgi:hypothetical protein
MIAPLDLNRVSSNDLQKACAGLDPVAAQLVGLGLPQALQGTGHAERLLGKAQDAYQAGDAKQPASAGEQPTVGSQPSTAGPHANYSQHAAQTRGTYYTPLDTDTAKLSVGSGKAYLSGDKLARVLNSKDPKYVSTENPQGFQFPSLRSSVIKKHDIKFTTDGKALLPSQGQAAAASLGAGQAQNPIAEGTASYMQRWGWLQPSTGMLGAGMGTGFAGQVAGQMNAAAGQMPLAGLAGGAGIPGGGSIPSMIGGAGMPGGGAMKFMAGGAMGAQMIGLDGMAFQMRKVMRSVAEDFKDDAMIGMIQNEGIPIEDLIFMFMAHMSEKYEYKLREKMEEAAMQEKRERKREMRSQIVGALGGIASLVPGVGTLVSGAMQAGVTKLNQVEAALNGEVKSTTMLMNEIQMLMHKWKQMNEMLSNLMKAMHDMAMTPIRNIR